MLEKEVNSAENRTIPLNLVHRFHPDEWVIMRLEGADKSGLPSNGEVVAHGEDYKLICEELRKIRAQSSSVGDSFYLTRAMEPAVTDSELMETFSR